MRSDTTHWFAAALVSIALMMGTLCAARPALADTSASTGITVTIQNAGALAVSFADAAPLVLTGANGEPVLGISAVDSATATVTMHVQIVDTRAEGSREPYRVTLRAGDLVSTVPHPDTGLPATLPASRLSIATIAGVATLAIGTLDVRQTIYTAPSEPASGTIDIEIVLRLTIPASSFAATYAATPELGIEPELNMPWTLTHVFAPTGLTVRVTSG